MRGRLGLALGVAGFVATNLLILTGLVGGLRAAVALPTVAVVPGALALRALRLPARTGWDWLLHAIALSLLGLIAVAFTLSLLPLVLPVRTLTTIGCLIGFDALVALLATAAAAAPTRILDSLTGYRRSNCPRSLGVGGAAGVLVGAVAVGLAVVGAHRLNHGGTAGLTELALAGAAVALVPAALAARRGEVTAAATAVYLLGLAILLATSLRGTGVTGHDIKIEYRVFIETLNRGSWRPGGPFAGYNSCLSITVLPAFLTRLLGVAPLDVFRVCFQLLFATIPVGVFLVVRRFLPAGYAVLGAGLFVAFPAFVNDMPMLNRQEIALVFFTVAMLSVLAGRGTPRQRVTLFAALAAGLTVSHYTSTYIAAGLLATGWLLRQVRRWFARRARRRPDPRLPAAHGVLGLGAALLIVLAVGWAAVTGSAGALGGGLRDAAVAVADRAGVYSGSTRYSVVSPVKEATDAEALQQYAAYFRGTGTGDDAPPPHPGCGVVPGPGDILPTTAAGAALARVGLPPGTVNTALRRAAVVLFEAGAAVGCAVAWFRGRKRGQRGRHARTRGGNGANLLPELTAAALALLAATVVAPQLSDSYGLLRLYQQLLVILAPAVLFALVVPLRRRAALLTGAVVVGCLLTTSGLVPKLTGDYPPQLNLTNGGAYFRAYYTAPVDVAVMGWVNAHVAGHGFVVADSRDSANLRAMTPLYPMEGLIPGAVPPDGYVQVTTMDGRTANGVAVVGDRALRYTFPLDCVTAGRELVHVDGTRRVYSPVVGP